MVPPSSQLRIVLLVSCANRKSQAATHRLQLRNSAKGDIDLVCQEWVRHVRHADPVEQAARLYRGEYWSVVRPLLDLRRSDVVVISAGLGARKPNELIPSYAATFDMNSLDAVGRRILTDKPRTTASRWWELVSSGLDASIRSRLATRRSPAILITALSDPYLEAIQQELQDLSQEFIGTIVLGARRGPQTARYVSLKPGIRLSLGGSSFSTSVRVASAILNQHEAHPFEGTSEIEEFVQNLQAKSPDVYPVNRRRLSDTEITAFIREQIRSNGSTTKSSCLRALRNSGNACEQGRFSLLFSQARTV